MKHSTKIALTVFLAMVIAIPFIAQAATLNSFIQAFTKLLRDSVVGLIFTVAFVYFFWGVVQYVLNPNEDSKEKGRMMMINGLIALTVMFSVYSLVRIVMNTFDFSEDEALEVPVLPD